MKGAKYLYATVSAAAGLAGFLGYELLCPTDENACFRRFGANLTMVVACVGFILLYSSRGLFGELGEEPAPVKPSARFWVARSLHVVGATIVFGATSWFLGCALAPLR